MDDLQGSMENVSKKTKSAAQYFCQDASKFKLEELLVEILTFVRDFSNAKKVSAMGESVPSQEFMCHIMKV